MQVNGDYSQVIAVEGFAKVRFSRLSTTYKSWGFHPISREKSCQLTESVTISGPAGVGAWRSPAVSPSRWAAMIFFLTGKDEYRETPEPVQADTVAAPTDGDARRRWRRRCRQLWRCTDCGASVGVGNCAARCSRCASRRGLARHLRRALLLWCHGAPEEHVARLVIGPTPRRRRRLPPAEPLGVRCCGRVAPVESVAARCGRCGRDLFGGPLVERSVRRRLLRGTEASRLAETVG